MGICIIFIIQIQLVQIQILSMNKVSRMCGQYCSYNPTSHSPTIQHKKQPVQEITLKAPTRKPNIKYCLIIPENKKINASGGYFNLQGEEIRSKMLKLREKDKEREKERQAWKWEWKQGQRWKQGWTSRQPLNYNQKYKQKVLQECQHYYRTDRGFNNTRVFASNNYANTSNTTANTNKDKYSTNQNPIPQQKFSSKTKRNITSNQNIFVLPNPQASINTSSQKSELKKYQTHNNSINNYQQIQDIIMRRSALL